VWFGIAFSFAGNQSITTSFDALHMRLKSKARKTFRDVFFRKDIKNGLSSDRFSDPVLRQTLISGIISVGSDGFYAKDGSVGHFENCIPLSD
jgi:hypothetical protein